MLHSLVPPGLKLWVFFCAERGSEQTQKNIWSFRPGPKSKKYIHVWMIHRNYCILHDHTQYPLLFLIGRRGRGRSPFSPSPPPSGGPFYCIQKELIYCPPIQSAPFSKQKTNIPTTFHAHPPCPQHKNIGHLGGGTTVWRESGCFWCVCVWVYGAGWGG